MRTLDNKNAIIRMFHVHKRYGHKYALQDVNLDIKKNEFVFVCGPSGAGKTTLMKLFYMGESFSEGQILVDGVNVNRIPKRRIPLLRRKFGIIFQDFKLISTKTVYDNVALVLEVAGVKKQIIHKKVKNVLRTVGMEDKADIYPLSLSGGEQQRVAVARAVVGAPKIILADEPTSNLDNESANIILNLLKLFHQRGATIIIATHNTDLIFSTQGRIVYLDQGTIKKTQPKPLPTIL